jgi:hypothetical protein
MCGRKMQHMLMGRIAEERPPLSPAAQLRGDKGDVAPLGDETAHVQAPVGVEIIHHPVIAGHSGQLVDNVGQMGGKIGTSARRAQIPHDVPRGHHERGKQHACPMPDVLVLAFFRFARGDGLRGVFPLQNLHAGLFIGADHHPALFKETQGVEI